MSTEEENDNFMVRKRRRVTNDLFFFDQDDEEEELEAILATADEPLLRRRWSSNKINKNKLTMGRSICDLSKSSILKAMKAIVVGGSGNLGKALVRNLLETEGVSLVVNIGRHRCEFAHRNVLIREDQTIDDATTKFIVEELKNDAPFNAIYCVSGGWAGGNLASDTILKSTEQMLNASVMPAMLSCTIATHLFQDSPFSPLLVLCGSFAATKPTPTMISYGIAKASVHFLASTMAANPSAAGLPSNTRIHCIVPDILDTPENREAMPSSDFSKWTNLDSLSAQLTNFMVNSASTEGLSTIVEV